MELFGLVSLAVLARGAYVLWLYARRDLGALASIVADRMREVQK